MHKTCEYKDIMSLIICMSSQAIALDSVTWHMRRYKLKFIWLDKDIISERKKMGIIIYVIGHRDRAIVSTDSR